MFYDAFEGFLQAGMNHQAHDIAVLEIAPDVVIRRDLDVLKNVFKRFTASDVVAVEAWSLRGKVICYQILWTG